MLTSGGEAEACRQAACGSLPNAAHPAFDVAEIGELPAADSGMAAPAHMRLPA